ncbi:MAG: 16S rRNA (cytosine(1402)-N(4))-methyltransferase RsmH, partial [Pseudomonadota bacterium]
MHTDSIERPHIPVLLNEVLEYLNPHANEIYVDGTLGAGGYTRAILDASKNVHVIGFDRDKTAHDMASTWSVPYSERLTLVKSSFAEMGTKLDEMGVGQVDAIILDLGVSSMQIDEAERGFSFRFDAPLDMRMDRSTGRTAANLVNELPEKELADLIYLYGEERKSRHVASAIIRARAIQKITTTTQLVDIVRGAIPSSPKDKINPATRTFQALRIAVNDELGQLESILEQSEKALKAGGRLIVVTFHSLEDRIVKNFMTVKSKPAPSPSRHLPQQLET